MKQYVLDQPIAGAPLPPAEAHAPAPAQPGWWRWLLMAILIEAVALALLAVALNGVPGASAAEPSRGIAYVASFSFPRDAEAAPASAHTLPAEIPVSRIREERGRYLVDLHDESAAGALAMLTKATKARVAGSAIFSGSPLRLTRSVVAGSPREAWQAVFGDVANFAIACAGNACDVRFVSLAKPGTPSAGPDALQGELSRAEAPTAPAFVPPSQARVDRATAAAPALQDNDGAPIDN
jgi:hypothetical protein